MWQISSLVHVGNKHHGSSLRNARVLIVLLALVSATTAYSTPDVLIRDCPSDGGTEPSSVCNPVHWRSPAIWTRLSPGSGTPHQCPIAGLTAYVNVEVENAGSSTLGYGEVKVYFAAASTGISKWPGHWNGNGIWGDYIGSAPVSNLGAGQSIIVEIPWPNVPANAVGDHFCLLARFESAEDPMKVPEGIVMYDNARENNNIAWRNLCSIKASKPDRKCRIHNDRAYSVNTELNFNQGPGSGEIPLPDGLQIRILLGGLYTKWVNGGQIGNGPGIIDEPHNNAIVVTNAHEFIGNLDLGAGDDFIIELYVIFPGDHNFNIHEWDISQSEEGNVIGGIGLDIDMSDDEGLKRIVDPRKNLSTKLNLSAQPNVGASTIAIGFTLPADDRITLGIYDMNGRLVRTLLSESTKTSGRHEMVWDGQSDAGTQASSGTYFYRLSTQEGVAEEQLKIVR